MGPTLACVDPSGNAARALSFDFHGRRPARNRSF